MIFITVIFYILLILKTSKKMGGVLADAMRAEEAESNQVEISPDDPMENM